MDSRFFPFLCFLSAAGIVAFASTRVKAGPAAQSGLMAGYSGPGFASGSSSSSGSNHSGKIPQASR